ncbi:hypothetical protein ES703_67945 [subsurface metagenome]
MPEQCQSGHGSHHKADPEVFVALTELHNSGFFIRVVHKIYIALQNLRIKLQGIFYQAAVILILFILQHIHEGAVIDPVHSQGPDKIALHQPEGLGQEQGVRSFLGYTVNHFPPKLLRHQAVKLLPGHAVLRPGGYISP